MSRRGMPLKDGSLSKSKEYKEREAIWVNTQKKAFKNWANYYLKERGLQIKNLDEDLKDGVLLINLVEVLTGKSVGKYTRIPKLKVQKINNINLALEAIRSSRSTTVTASAEDLHDGNVKPLLGLMWTLVHEFQLQPSGAEEETGTGKQRNPLDSLVAWLIDEVNREPYNRMFDPNTIRSDFTGCFRDGKLLNFLVHRAKPAVVDLNAVSQKSPEENLRNAIDLAERELGIPQILDPEDVMAGAEDKILLTYVSYFRNLRNNPVAEVASALSKTQGKIEDISQRQAHTYRELEESKQKMRELEDMVKKLHDEGGEKEKLKDKYQRKVKDLEDEISALKQSIRDMERSHTMEVESLKGKISNLKEKRDNTTETLQRQVRDSEDKARSAQQALISTEEQNTRLKRDNDSLKRRLSDAEGRLDKQLQASEEMIRKLQERDRDIELLTEEKKQFEKRAKAGWDAKQRSDEEQLEMKKKFAQKKNKWKSEKDTLEKAKQDLTLELEKVKASGGDTEALKKELKQEKAKRKLAETDLEREKTKANEEREENQRKNRRLEDRVHELEAEIESKEKELKRRNQALDKGTDMTQSLMNSLTEAKKKLMEAIAEKENAEQAELNLIRDNEKMKIALDETKEKLEREKKKRKKLEEDAASDKGREAEYTEMQNKIRVIEGDRDTMRTKIVKLESDKEDLQSQIKTLESTKEKDDTIIKELTEDKARLEEKNQHLESQRAGMVSSIASLEGEKERMKKEKEQLENKLHEVNESKKIEEERVNELDKKLVALQHVNDKSKAQVAALEKKVAELEKNEDQMNELKAKAAALEEQNVKNEASIKELEKALRDKEKASDETIRDLEKKLREKQGQDDRIKDLTEQIDQLTAQNRRLADDIDDLRRDKDERVKELEKTADDLVKEYETEKQRADDLEKELAELREHAAQSSKRNEMRVDKDMKRKLKELQEKSDKAEEKVKELDEEVEHLQEDLGKVEEELEKEKDKCKAAEEQGEKQRAKLEKVKKKKAQLKEELAKAKELAVVVLSAEEQRKMDNDRIKELEARIKELEQEVADLKDDAEKMREKLAKMQALENELAELKRKIEEDKRVKNITKMEQQVQEKSEALVDDLEFELEEEMANAPEDEAIPINRKEDSLTYQELKELKQELELRLEEERANNNDREIKYKKEIEKLKQELEQERKEVIRLDVQLDTVQASKDAEVENVRQQMLEKMENLKSELREVKEYEKVADQRIKELESQKEKLQLEKANEVKEAMRSRKATSDYKIIMDIEDLIRQLYFHLGSSLQIDEIEEEHRENVRFLDIVNDLRKQVDNVIDDITDNYYKDPIPSGANADTVRDYVIKLRKFRHDIKRERNDFVRACNKLGLQYENKSTLEQDMEEWRDKLVDLILNEEDKISPDNKELMADLDKVRRLLRDDDSQRDEVRAYRKDKLFARLNVDKKIEDLRKYILEDIHYNENKRLRDLLTDLKEANRRLQASSHRAVLQQTFYISREQKARIAKVIGLMIQHYRILFKEYTSSPVNDQVHPMVRRPITYLERRGVRCKDILSNVRLPPANKVQDLKDGFYSGNDMDIPDGSDPYVIGELLKEYFRDLRQPLCTYKRYEVFDQINDLPPARQLRELRNCIDELPKVRRATLTVLIGFLHKVKTLSTTNNMNTENLAEIFGPLLLRPFQDR